MSADSEKPNIIGVIGRNIALWQNLWVGIGRFERRSSSARARRLRSAAGSIDSGRHILESRCAERCANDEFSTSFRATLKVVYVTPVSQLPVSIPLTALSPALPPPPSLSPSLSLSLSLSLSSLHLPHSAALTHSLFFVCLRSYDYPCLNLTQISPLAFLLLSHLLCPTNSFSLYLPPGLFTAL